MGCEDVLWVHNELVEVDLTGFLCEWDAQDWAHPMILDSLDSVDSHWLNLTEMDLTKYSNRLSICMHAVYAKGLLKTECFWYAI